MEQTDQLCRFLEDTASAESEAAKRGESGPLSEKPVPEGTELLVLPEPELLQDRHVNFLELIELRTTQRQYSFESLNLQDLSYLLWCTQGVKASMSNGLSMRNVPSAGARHAFETYLFIQRVDGLRPGIYRFLAFEHALVRMDQITEDKMKEIPGLFSGKSVVEGSAVTFLWIAEAERMLYRFGLRGIRYLYLDAGHVCENLYLAAESLHAGVCALGSFADKQLDEVLGLDSSRGEFVIYGAAVGRKL